MDPYILRIVVVGLLASLANTQSTAQKTWASVVYTISGETTPILLPNTSPHLTPLGANQLYNVGSLVRARFLEATNSSLTNISLINGLASTEVDNTLISVYATDSEWVSVGAQAFMQGLYPPLNRINVDRENILANGTLEEWPLDGYQYANIRTFSEADYNRIWLAGSEGCPYWDIASSTYLQSSEYNTVRQSTASFYQSLEDSLYNSILPTPQLSYYNALPLYDYAYYETIYNATLADILPSDSLDRLHNLANEMAFALYGNTSVSMTPGDQIGVMGGRTLATLMTQLLASNINHSGTQDKMSLLFGDYGSMLSFFALSGLSDTSPIFTSIPQPGSVMAFELFSVNDSSSSSSSSTNEDSGSYPDTSDLWVRFLFRNGTDPSTPLLSYPLFNRGNSQADMPWFDFVSGIEKFAIDGVEDWCSTCDSGSVWCTGIDSDFGSDLPDPSSSSGSSHGMRPVIAGIVGALVTLATILLLTLILFLLGFRVEKHDSVLSGGFKRRSRGEEDRDVIVAPDGKGATVKHERVGSWELNDNAGNDAAKLNMVAGAAGPAPAYQKEEEEWEVDPFGKAVEVREQV